MGKDLIPWLIVAGDLSLDGGMDRANYALASRLAATGHEVHVVAHHVDATLKGRVAVDVVPRPMGSHALGMPLLARSGWRHAAELSPRRASVVTNGGNCGWPDVNWVHYVHAAYDPSFEGAPLSRALSGAQRRYVLDRERRALTRARLVICNSARTRADVTERLRVDPARTRVVYYGTDPARFSPITPYERAAARAMLRLEDHAAVALFVGALGDRRKGFDALFDAWTALSSDGSWSPTLLVAGRGRELPAWTARAARAGLGSRIQFLGFRHDVPSLLAAADLLIHPARYEAYGLSVHEAICRGVPVIVNASAGVAERLPEMWRPLLLDDISPQAISRALYEWRTSHDRFAKVAAAMAASWRARSWDDMADELAALVSAG
jgi:glycosyltransferase involved in cell wall biosynthesis